MFFINLEADTKERFDITKFIGFTDNFDILQSYALLKLKELPIGGTYNVNGEEGRPELLSYNIYGSTQYWWILMLYNDFQTVEDVKNGATVSFPTINELDNFYFALKIRETAVNNT